MPAATLSQRRQRPRAELLEHLANHLPALAEIPELAKRISLQPAADAAAFRYTLPSHEAVPRNGQTLTVSRSRSVMGRGHLGLPPHRPPARPQLPAVCLTASFPPYQPCFLQCIKVKPRTTWLIPEWELKIIGALQIVDNDKRSPPSTLKKAGQPNIQWPKGDADAPRSGQTAATRRASVLFTISKPPRVLDNSPLPPAPATWS